MKIKILPLAAALSIAAAANPPAARAADAAIQPPRAAAEPTSSQVDAEMVAYGKWLVDLQSLEAPVLAGFAQFRSEWQSVDRADQAAVRAFGDRIGQFHAVVDEVSRKIGALPAPHLTALGLPDDVTPAAIKRDQIALNVGVKTLLSDLQSLLSAEGLAATERAASQLFRGVELMLDHQIRFARASLSTTDKSDSSWDLGNVQLILFRAMRRLVAPMIEAGPQLSFADGRLAGDFVALADQLSVFRSGGERKRAAEIEELRLAASDAAKERDADRLRLIRRSLAVLELGRGYTALAADLEKALRSAALRLNEQPIPLQTLAEQLQPFAQVKARFEQIAAAESAALAGP